MRSGKEVLKLPAERPCRKTQRSAILRSRADSLRSHVILHERLAFYSAFLNIHRSGVLTALFDCYVTGAT